MNESSNIAIFDSGVGGLTVMKAISKLLPYENIIYFGDTARIPYGTKSKTTVMRYALEISQFLLQLNIKIIVIACHTASAYSLQDLKGYLKIPIVGMIEPSVDYLTNSFTCKKIGIIGTKGTIQSKAYQNSILFALPHVQLFAVACPLFVPLVEEGYLTHSITTLAIEDHLQTIKQASVDSLLLGCTHYPLLKNSLQHYLGPKTRLIDPGIECAAAVFKRLARLNLLNKSTQAPEHSFFVTDDPEKFRCLGEKFLMYPIQHCHLASLEKSQYKQIS
jgi:glutamate racemase